jgi:phosphopentomutase
LAHRTPSQRTSRVLLLVLDSAGVGELPDASRYGDCGAATLPNLARAVSGLKVPNLEALGLGNITPIEGVNPVKNPSGFHGKLAEQSPGKDTTTGHWEMMGLVLKEAFRTFPNGFPPEITNAFENQTGRGILGNKTASGTAILDELGKEHIKTGKWILYTSADSVFQVAAHEEVVPLEELYEACRKARALLNPLRVGRVIARPFVGSPGCFQRTYHRHDFSILPDGPTVLTALQKASVPVIGVGKISDIFAGVGIDRSETTSGNDDSLKKTLSLLDEIDRGFLFVNLIDFDMAFGHRRDAAGYARALEDFDRALPQICSALTKEDLLLITADHGCDPTCAIHTDHTREYVPLLAFSKAFGRGGDLGTRRTFADVGATVAEALGARWTGAGMSLLGDLEKVSEG